MKLSKAQQAIIDQAHRETDFARTHTLEEWAEKQAHVPNKDHPWSKWFIEEYGEAEFEKYRRDRIKSYSDDYGKYYEREKNAIVLCIANTRTIEKLEKLGLIRIIKKGGSSPDSIEILNY